MNPLEQQILKSKPQNYNKLIDQLKNCPKVPNLQNIEYPLKIDGIKIVDNSGKRVKLVGVNWSGGHLIRQCPSGLDKQPLKQLISKIKNEFKLNCIRLCYSVQMIFDSNPLDEKYISANPDLFGMTPFEVLNKVIEQLTNEGIMVILNSHTSKSQWCCDSKDGDGLWYNNDYPENMFFLAAEKLAFRHKSNYKVIGMDLRNQIRQNNGIHPEWGTGNRDKDWKIAAQECAERVLNIFPQWLIFVGGLNYQIDLTGVFNHPIKLSIPNKVIYTGHLYEESFNHQLCHMGLQQKMRDLSYEQFSQIFYAKQLFVRSLGYPYLLGQFGHHSPWEYWNLLSRYIKQNDVDFTYWCLDGYKCHNVQKGDEQEHYGLFHEDFCKVRHDFKLDFCKSCNC